MKVYHYTTRVSYALPLAVGMDNTFGGHSTLSQFNFKLKCVEFIIVDEVAFATRCHSIKRGTIYQFCCLLGRVCRHKTLQEDSCFSRNSDHFVALAFDAERQARVAAPTILE